MTTVQSITRPALTAFAKELRAARLRAGMSKVLLAKRAGMTREGLFKIEKGHNVTLGTIALLAHALGCQVGDFFPRRTPNYRWTAGMSDWHLRGRVQGKG